MVSFSNKKIAAAPLVGEILKKRREDQGLTIEQAALTLGLSTKYIRILEMNAWQKLPGQVYSKSFIKKYAGFLGLNPEEILNQYLEDQHRFLLTAVVPKKHPRPSLGLRHFSSLPFVFRQIAVSALIILLALYLSYEVSGMFSPPQLLVESPVEGRVDDSQTIVVKGKTEPEAKVQVNGKEVVSDASGAFATNIGLQTGLNVIKISATKKHGGTSTVSRNIVLESPK